MVSTASPALRDVVLTWKARTGGDAGSTPEELIGAAHAGCFSMALSGALDNAGHAPRALDVQATVEFGPTSGGHRIRRVALALEAEVPGIDQATFERLANEAKLGCPVSQALEGNVEVELVATLLPA